MTRQVRLFVPVMMLLGFVHPLAAQAPAPAPVEPAPPASAASSSRDSSNAPVPVQLQIAIARYQGAKRISSFPYVVSLTGRPSTFGGSTARLRMNGSVPVSTTMVQQGDDGKASTLSSYNYREIGTNIDVNAIPSAEGRFGFTVTVTDSSVYGEGDVKGLPTTTGLPMFRSFTASSAVHLQDGETAEFTAAADRLTGEVTRVEVTLTVLK